MLPSVVKPSGEIAERGKRHPTWPNLYHKQASYTKFKYSALCLAPLSLRSAVAKPVAAYFSAPLSGRREVSGIRLGDRLVG